jgi:hypothetical protein
LTAFCQTITTEEIQKRIKKDSVTYSWKKANEFVNGLENEVRLDTAYNILSRENEALLKTYNISQGRVISYQDTIVPALRSIIIINEANVEDLNKINKSSETLLKKQRMKKWWWFLLGFGGGVATYSILK